MENNEAPPQKETAQTAAEELLSKEDFKRIIENLLFITDRPLSPAKLSQTAQVHNAALTREIIRELQQDYANTGRAIQIVELGGGFQMATKPEYGRWVRALFNEKNTTKLSAAALETLAIIAYKQPVTRAEIEAIRGVDIVAPLEKIMERGLARVVGKRDTPGKPMVYGTTEEFLRLFGLNKLSELPEIETFAGKGLKDIQSDLPFTEPLAPIGGNIIPLTEEESLEFNYRPSAREEQIFEEEPAPQPGPKQEAPKEDEEITTGRAEEVISGGMAGNIKEIDS
ncbi:MAG: SMC-Scp complex subunit ScpB [Elusimicrobiota bacterium]|jgi:segregation and condensation protein B|nr:SMC-Scp complex subunit ScpB [Elusimicrobiota bacterium]